MDNKQQQKLFCCVLAIPCFLKMQLLMIMDHLYFLSSAHFSFVPLFVQLDINEMFTT